MGTIERRMECPKTTAETPDVHGVLHYISQADYMQIVKTEGGGGDPEFGYQTVVVPCELILDEVPEDTTPNFDLLKTEDGLKPKEA
ncbi:hypothetical protein HDU93_000647, partial [Gonapodya sp. JEL0774]